MLLTFLSAVMIAKHFIISNVIDFCYSDARDQRNVRWFWHLFLWSGLELFTSYCLYLTAGVRKGAIFLIAEGAICVASVLSERRAQLGAELRTYFIWETLFFLFYVLIGVFT